MPSLYSEININAPQSVVWDALVRKDQWRFWNTFLYDCDPGLRIARGNEIFLAMQRLEGDEETEFQPLITMLRPPTMMRWVSTIPGLRCEHVFELRENVPGQTRYIHREIFSGVLSKVFLPFIRQDERQGLRRMSQQLKMYVEHNMLGERPRNYQPYRQDPYAQEGYRQDAYGYPPRSQPQYNDRYYDNRYYDDRGYGGGGYNDRQYQERQYQERQYQEKQYPDRPYDAPPPSSQPPRSQSPNYDDRRNQPYDDRYDRRPPDDHYGEGYNDREYDNRDYPQNDNY